MLKKFNASEERSNKDCELTHRLWFQILALVLGLLGTSSCSFSGMPSDSELTSTFRLHQQDLERLVRMSDQDASVTIIQSETIHLHDKGDFSKPVPDVGFSAERWESYRKLFRRLGLQQAEVTRKNLSTGGEDEHGDVYLTFSASGMVGRGRAKGIVYMRKAPPASLEKSSLDFPSDLGTNFRRSSTDFWYKQISGPWYLWYYVSY